MNFVATGVEGGWLDFLNWNTGTVIRTLVQKVDILFNTCN